MDDELSRSATEAVEHAARLHRRAVVLAAQIAETEEYAADVLEQVAAAHPDDAERLATRAREAREFAARERKVAESADE